MKLETKLGIGITAGIIVISILPVFLSWYCDYREVRQGNGNLEWTAWIGEGGGAGVLALEHLPDVEVSGDYRLSVLDPATGALRARRVLEDRAACRNATANRIWCQTQGKILLIDGLTLQDLATQEQLIARNESLTVGLSGFRPQVNPATGGLVVGTNDGLRAEISAVQTAARQVSEKTEYPELDDDRSPVSSQVVAGDFDIREKGNSSTDRQVLVRRTRQSGEEVPLGLQAESGQPAAPPTGSYLKISFLSPWDVALSKDYTLEDPAGFFMIHQTSLDDETANRLISRMDLEGRAIWTATLPPRATIEAAYVFLDSLIVSMKDPLHRTEALEIKTGVPRWTHLH
jgi:hypothetical protein